MIPEDPGKHNNTMITISFDQTIITTPLCPPGVGEETDYGFLCPTHCRQADAGGAKLPSDRGACAQRSVPPQCQWWRARGEPYLRRSGNNASMLSCIIFNP